MLVLVTLLSPVGVRAASPGPTEPCVPGTVWEDLSSGVKYLCIYDEMYGGTRSGVAVDGPGRVEPVHLPFKLRWLRVQHRRLSTLSGGGGNSMVRSFRWPCSTFADRTTQPPASCGSARTSSGTDRRGRRAGTRVLVQHDHGVGLGGRHRHGRGARLRRRDLSNLGDRPGLPGRCMARRVRRDSRADSSTSRRRCPCRRTRRSDRPDREPAARGEGSPPVRWARRHADRCRWCPRCATGSRRCRGRSVTARNARWSSP